MIDSLPIQFWYGVVAFAGAVLIYRASRRRSVNRALSGLAGAYEAGLATLRAPYPTVRDGEASNFLLPWAIQQSRGGGDLAAFDQLTKRERRLVELTHAAIVLDDKAFGAIRTRVTKPELDLLDAVRDMGKDARTSLAQIKGDRVRQRMSRILEPARMRQPVAEAAMPDPVSDETRFMQVDDIVPWLPGTEDPDLWHLLVSDLNYGYPSTLAIVEWIASQPDCDRATAALALIRIEADAYMQHETREAADYHGGQWSIAKTICERSEADGYTHRELNLSSIGEENDQAGMIEMLGQVARELAAQGKTLPWPLPETLFSQPFEGRDVGRDRYEVNDDRLYFLDKAA